MADALTPDGREDGALAETDVAADPVTQFRAWLDAAQAAGVPDARAAVVATADADGRPSARTMILREVDARGFTFFTSHESRKGRELAANPRAALTFLWQPVHRQVLVTGDVVRLADEEADQHFAGRPRGFQLAAWAAPQSSVLPDRATLDTGLAEAAARYEGRPVPRPPDWGGFHVVPDSVELWQERPDRLHDRLRYRRDGGGWVLERLAP